MKFGPSKYQAGFTFLELIVVFSVMAIISTVGVVSFNQYNKSQEINGSVSDIVNILNLAKSNSRSQIKPAICDSLGYTLKSYRVTINISTHSTFPNSLELHAECLGPSGPLDLHYYGTGENPNTPLRLTLPKNIEIENVLSNVSTKDDPKIFFYPLFQGDVDGGKICIDSDGAAVKSIEVNELGVVSLGSPC